jgi:L-asparaginase
VGKPRVLLVSTGGTVASRFEEGKGYSPAVKGDDILRDFPEVHEAAEIEAVQCGNVLSFALYPDTVMKIVRMVSEKLKKEDFHGAVITQGTATMEESAYLADLLWDLEKPLVFTGSMFSSSEKDWDGPRNILNAVLVAASPLARNKGAMVCVGGEIHAARDVVKMHKSSLVPYASLNAGPLGMFVNKRDIIFNRAPLLRKVFLTDKLENRVDIIKVAMGSDARLLDASIKSGAKAIVLESLPGGGGVTPEIMAAVRNARNDGFIFAMTPRSPLGSALSVAGGGCGPWDLRQCGVITAGDLPSVKARIIFMVTLPLGKDFKELMQIFHEIAP